MLIPWCLAARYEVMQIGSQLNALVKDIGKRKKVDIFVPPILFYLRCNN